MLWPALEGESVRRLKGEALVAEARWLLLTQRLRKRRPTKDALPRWTSSRCAGPLLEHLSIHQWEE